MLIYPSISPDFSPDLFQKLVKKFSICFLATKFPLTTHVSG
jgi:hypothetical protein